jgi:hypothetical protein
MMGAGPSHSARFKSPLNLDKAVHGSSPYTIMTTDHEASAWTTITSFLFSSLIV